MTVAWFGPALGPAQPARYPGAEKTDPLAPPLFFCARRSPVSAPSRENHQAQPRPASSVRMSTSLSPRCFLAPGIIHGRSWENNPRASLAFMTRFKLRWPWLRYDAKSCGPFARRMTLAEGNARGCGRVLSVTSISDQRKLLQALDPLEIRKRLRRRHCKECRE